ncbi:rhodanese-like domain-containing protein [Kaarinaea lacus]
MRKIANLLVLAICLFSFTGAIAADKEGFPGRKKYPKVPYIELADLAKQFNDVVVVDARSTLEFETLHIKGSVNIPVAKKDFPEQIVKLRSTTDKPIIFYCNGRTCMKSFKATQAAMDAGVKNVFSYDAGIFEWTKAHPKLAVLLGESPVNVARLIPKKDLKKRFLKPDDFSDRATAGSTKTMILDVRDKYQRAGIGFYPGKERWASLDERKKLRNYIKKAISQNRTLMIYDEVGKQVRWLQYELEKAGAKDYYFMDKGAKGYFAAMDAWGEKK